MSNKGPHDVRAMFAEEPFPTTYPSQDPRLLRDAGPGAAREELEERMADATPLPKVSDQVKALHANTAQLQELSEQAVEELANRCRAILTRLGFDTPDGRKGDTRAKPGVHPAGLYTELEDVALAQRYALRHQLAPGMTYINLCLERIEAVLS